MEPSSKPSVGPGLPAAVWAWGWPSDPTPSSPKAVLKRLMGVEPSVMRADFRPRLWSSFTWKRKRGAGGGLRPCPFSALGPTHIPLPPGLPPKPASQEESGVRGEEGERGT